jgi:hypothetical protein
MLHYYTLASHKRRLVREMAAASPAASRTPGSAALGFGRIVALHYCLSNLYQIH